MADKKHQGGPEFLLAGVPAPERIKLCNCAECGREILGESHRAMWDALEPALVLVVWCRVKGRPYCRDCATRTPPLPRAATRDEFNPWGENAVRDLEEAPGAMEDMS